MVVIFVSTVKSSSQLSMTYNPTKFPYISNNKSYSFVAFFPGFFPDTAKYIGVTHSIKKNVDQNFVCRVIISALLHIYDI